MNPEATHLSGVFPSLLCTSISIGVVTVNRSEIWLERRCVWFGWGWFSASWSSDPVVSASHLMKDRELNCFS